MQLYIAKVPIGSGYGSGSDQKGPDPTGSGSATLVTGTARYCTLPSVRYCTVRHGTVRNLSVHDRLPSLSERWGICEAEFPRHFKVFFSSRRPRCWGAVCLKVYLTFNQRLSFIGLLPILCFFHCFHFSVIVVRYLPYRTTRRLNNFIF